MEIKRNQRSILQDLQIPFKELKVGWDGHKRYGWRPRIRLVVADEFYYNTFKPYKNKYKEIIGYGRSNSFAR